MGLVLWRATTACMLGDSKSPVFDEFGVNLHDLDLTGPAPVGC